MQLLENFLSGGGRGPFHGDRNSDTTEFLTQP